jgi:hypothetical protein
MSTAEKYSKESQTDFVCPDCGVKVSPKTIFCFECGPPDPPKREPEETGISLEQAFVRIAGLVFLFLCITFVKIYISNGDLGFFSDSDSQIEHSINGKKKLDDNFELIHIVKVKSANVRSKPSFDGKIIAIVEEGMKLTLLEKKEEWSKIIVFEKTGWIASRLIKSEVQEIK